MKYWNDGVMEIERHRKHLVLLFHHSNIPCLLRLCVAALAEQGRQAGIIPNMQ